MSWKRSQRAAYPLALIPFLDLMSEMDHNQVKRYLDENAENRTRLAKADYNFYRDYLNKPAFFAMLLEVKGLSGLDIGCGEVHKPGCLQTLAQVKVDLPNFKIPIFTWTLVNGSTC